MRLRAATAWVSFGFFSVLRYVERNALRAELAVHAEDWKWSRFPGWLRSARGYGGVKGRFAMSGGWSG
jgi:hypothetical protein